MQATTLPACWPGRSTACWPAARTARWWPFVGSTAIAVSLLGPNYLADGAAAALITMHVVVGFILIWGFARFGRQPSWTSQWGTGTTSAR